ncbi:MAG: hypothetical protein IT379_06790 [Deltaproteobacteria bacterium]|nr:hypothetical protein [Deltaproteobacteria bacterium]
MRSARIVAAVAVALVAALLSRELRLRAFVHHRSTQRRVDVYYLPPASVLPVLTLGYRDAAASLVWCRALVYYGEELVHRGAVQHVFDYVEAITALDPDFRHAYLWIATTGIYRGTATGEPEVRRVIEFLERAVARWPDDGELRYQLGATYAFELVPYLPADRRPEAKARGVEELTIAARLGHGPRYLALTNVTQLLRLGRAEQAAQHVEEMLAVTRDDDTREQLLIRLAQLRSEAYAEGFRSAFQGLRDERMRSMPYVTDELFSFLRPTMPPVDAARLGRDGWPAALGEREEPVTTPEDEVEADDTLEQDAGEGDAPARP